MGIREVRGVVPAAAGEHQRQRDVLIRIGCAVRVQDGPTAIPGLPPEPSEKGIARLTQVVLGPAPDQGERWPVAHPDRTEHGVGLSFRGGDLVALAVDDAPVTLHEDTLVALPGLAQGARGRPPMARVGGVRAGAGEQNERDPDS